MVEILPYTEDDDAQANWVPLNAAGAPARRPAAAAAAGGAGGAAASAAPTKRDSHSAPCTEPGPQVQQGREKEGANAGKARAEDGEDSDDDEGWQKLSSPSRKEMQRQSSLQNSAASSAVVRNLSWSLGNKLLSHLTATPPKAARKVGEVEEDTLEQDDVVWRRPDALEDDIFDKRQKAVLQRNKQRSSIEEEYGDVPASMAAPKPNAAMSDRRIAQPSVRPQPRAELPECDDDAPEHPPFRRVPTDPQSTARQESPPKPTIKGKLQEKLIKDPLRALFPCFLRHLYHETKCEGTRMWEAWLERNPGQGSLPLLYLLLLAASFGVLLVAKGLFGLGMMALRASVRMSASFGAWWMRYSWAMANQLLWLSVCASLLFGAGAWLWVRFGGRGGKEATSDKPLWVPSISGLVPWIVAVASPSLLEAIVVVVSLRAYMGVFGTESRIIDECVAVADDDAEPFCLAEAGASSGAASSVAIFAVALLLAAANCLIVSASAKMLDQPKEGAPDEKATASSAPPPAPSASSNMRCIQRNLGLCHTVSIVSFSALAVATLLLQAIYPHFRDEGGSIFLSLANGLGKGGWNVACIALGVAVLVALWKAAASYITSDGVILDGTASFGDISRSALKKAVIEISSNAVWSSDGAGSGLLGILSDDDGALRVAILEWAIDRWASSRASDGSSSSDNASSTSASGDNGGSGNVAGSNPNMPSNASTSSPSSSSEEQPESSGGGASADSKPILPSYESLQKVINQLDADETLIPTIESYRAWVYSLPPTQNAAICVALWKMCPASATLGLLVVWVLCKFACKCLFFALMWVSGSSLVVVGHDRSLPIVCISATLMSPLLFLEYHRVRQWWRKTTSSLQDGESSDVSKRGEFAMNLMRADADLAPALMAIDGSFLLDVPSLLLCVWHLLLESISVLESSVPVARYATVATAAADLTSNTFCLVDLALEIKKHGLVGGAGLMIWDAFSYHLSKELEQRQQETDAGSSSHEDLGGGQYTGAMVNAGRNLGKMTHNISCLMSERSKSESTPCNEDGMPEEDTSSHPSDTQAPDTGKDEDVSCDAQCEDAPTDETQDSVGKESEGENLPSDKEEQPSPASNEGDNTNETDSNEKDNGPVPWLIGGGLAFVGAAAGIALHAVNSSNERDKKKKDRSK
ncbi:hypothetical protein ACHAXT_011092 [Thalassiosira profunda]